MLSLNSFTVGIVSGLVTALIIALFDQVWVKIINPWFEEKVYSDAKIEGRWESYCLDSTKCDLVDIKRVGHKVIGTITTIVGPDKGKIYAFTGTFRNLILTATYISDNKSYLDRGSFTLMLIENGDMLKGHVAYYLDDKHEIVSGEYELHKHK
jgi:hypothetical protein